MRGLTTREKRLLALCLLSIFVVANLFAGRAILRSLGGGRAKVKELENELSENRMWLEEKDLWDRRREWLISNLPPSLARQGKSIGNAQSELMQTLQNELFERKIRIDRQSLSEPISNTFYDEVAVYLRIRGEAAVINQWLATLQSPEKFQVIKTLELELDDKAKEVEPQAECEITVAKWFAPSAGESPAPAEPASPGTDPQNPAPAPESGGGDKLELTTRS
ncbi:MAG: hypothetical protein KDM63_13135 [Verrucomicrobiae bacterium]|nr:hypothetical protein [Verrucomicrobiae bacterium]MCB1087988.1 hypothetical protein [Verrucomicrobiae bacterium]MCB1092853.1 hypothetical protein [Verrucomicrobiae bacterium]